VAGIALNLFLGPKAVSITASKSALPLVWMISYSHQQHIETLDREHQLLQDVCLVA
jgi:hypothetical protein